MDITGCEKCVCVCGAGMGRGWLLMRINGFSRCKDRDG